MEIGDGAFAATDLAGTLVIPTTVTMLIGSQAFANTKVTYKVTGYDLGYDLRFLFKATSFA